MFRLKAILFLCLTFVLMSPQPVKAVALDFAGMMEVLVEKAKAKGRQLAEEASTKSINTAQSASGKKDKDVDEDELALPKSLTLVDDLPPMITLKTVRDLWGANGEKNPTIPDIQEAIIENYLIDSATLQTHNDYLKGGSKEGEKMPDTSQTPGTVRAQQKQYILSLLRGQALSRTLMKRADEMDKTNEMLAKIVETRDSEVELYQALAIIATQTDYLQNNLIVVKSALSEVEGMQSMQGHTLPPEGSGLLGSILKAVF